MVGDNVYIEDYAVLKSGTRLGDDASWGEYSMLLSGSRIGSGTKIGTYNESRKERSHRRQLQVHVFL
jgi:UDP-3-O-[3-hydroxymyristoyl] glucosamine N-acyltransferase